MPVSPKYRRLTSEELQPLEKDFIEFLVINGITADEWVKIKEEDLGKAEDMVTLFSDVVFEDILRNTKFLDRIEKDEVMTFQCLEKQIILVGLKSQNPNHDFTQDDFFNQLNEKDTASLQVYTTNKAYSKTREQELFDMLSNGCLMSDGTLFKKLSMLL